MGDREKREGERERATEKAARKREKKSDAPPACVFSP